MNMVLVGTRMVTDPPWNNGCLRMFHGKRASKQCQSVQPHESKSTWHLFHDDADSIFELWKSYLWYESRSTYISIDSQKFQEISPLPNQVNDAYHAIIVSSRKQNNSSYHWSFVFCWWWSFLDVVKCTSNSASLCLEDVEARSRFKRKKKQLMQLYPHVWLWRTISNQVKEHMLDRLMDEWFIWTKRIRCIWCVFFQTDDWPQIPPINTKSSFFSSTVHVTYHRDLEAHYRALLNITAQFRGKFPQHSISHLISAFSLSFLIALWHTLCFPSLKNKTLRHNPNTHFTVRCISSHHSLSVWQWRVVRLVTRKTHTSGCHQLCFLVAWETQTPILSSWHCNQENVIPLRAVNFTAMTTIP